MECQNNEFLKTDFHKQLQCSNVQTYLTTSVQNTWNRTLGLQF